jgi:hypothetical protein
MNTAQSSKLDAPSGKEVQDDATLLERTLGQVRDDRRDARAEYRADTRPTQDVHVG